MPGGQTSNTGLMRMTAFKLMKSRGAIQDESLQDESLQDKPFHLSRVKSRGWLPSRAAIESRPYETRNIMD